MCNSRTSLRNTILKCTFDLEEKIQFSFLTLHVIRCKPQLLSKEQNNIHLNQIFKFSTNYFLVKLQVQLFIVCRISTYIILPNIYSHMSLYIIAME
jgi:hypothetical protein